MYCLLDVIHLFGEGTPLLPLNSHQPSDWLLLQINAVS